MEGASYFDENLQSLTLRVRRLRTFGEEEVRDPSVSQDLLSFSRVRRAENGHRVRRPASRQTIADGSAKFAVSFANETHWFRNCATVPLRHPSVP